MASSADEGWIRHKSQHVISYTIDALRRLHEIPALRTSTNLGVPAFIVGAGPSLRLNGEHLRDAAARGLVIASNASDPCCEHYGVTPDVVVARESIDVSDQIRRSRAPIIALDISTHPENWWAARERGRWFIPSYPRHYELCRRLNVAPIEGGTSAITTAISLAHAWGCSPIVLVGVDCAMASDGATYHPAAPRGSQRGQLFDGGQRAMFTGNEQDAERHVRSGQRPQGSEAAVEWLAGWGGADSVASICTWSDQVDWLAMKGRQWPMGLWGCINASEGGAHIPGWKDTSLREACARLLRHEQVRPHDFYGGYVTPCDDIIAWLRRETDRLELVSEELLRDRPTIANLVHCGLASSPEIVEALASRGILDAEHEYPMGGPRKTRALARALIEAAQAARMLLEEDA